MRDFMKRLLGLWEIREFEGLCLGGWNAVAIPNAIYKIEIRMRMRFIRMLMRFIRKST